MSELLELWRESVFHIFCESVLNNVTPETVNSVFKKECFVVVLIKWNSYRICINTYIWKAKTITEQYYATAESIWLWINEKVTLLDEETYSSRIHWRISSHVSKLSNWSEITLCTRFVWNYFVIVNIKKLKISHDRRKKSRIERSLLK